MGAGADSGKKSCAGAPYRLGAHGIRIFLRAQSLVRAWMSVRARWVLAAVVGAAALLRLWRLGSESLWVDEAYTLSVAREGAWQVLLHHDNTPPLHALLLHFWIALAGTSEWALRFPSAVFGAAAVALTFPVARRIAGERAALVATALHAGSFYLWSVSQEART